MRSAVAPLALALLLPWRGSPAQQRAPAAAPAPAAAVTIVPRPDSVEPRPGAFVLRSPVRIVVATPGRRLGEIATLLGEWLGGPTGYRVTVTQRSARHGDIALALAPGGDPEAYVLTVAPTGIRIVAPAPEGVLWGAETLRQLLPPAFAATAAEGAAPETRSRPRPTSWVIPAVTIRDAPRFAWRGALLDAGRHFFPAPFVERFVDLLSRSQAQRPPLAPHRGPGLAARDTAR